ncbi:hypothetical protein QJS66_23105 [Kocuria rhizophila]|nr:hypothetical protein QJS66_23105 [Kocuria rhizophila]
MTVRDGASPATGPGRAEGRGPGPLEAGGTAPTVADRAPRLGAVPAAGHRPPARTSNSAVLAALSTSSTPWEAVHETEDGRTTPGAPARRRVPHLPRPPHGHRPRHRAPRPGSWRRTSPRPPRRCRSSRSRGPVCWARGPERWRAGRGTSRM